MAHNDRTEQIEQCSEPSLEHRVATLARIAGPHTDRFAIWLSVAKAIIPEVRAEVAREIEAFQSDPPFSPLEQAALTIAATIARGNQ